MIHLKRGTADRYVNELQQRNNRVPVHDRHMAANRSEKMYENKMLLSVAMTLG